MNPRSALEIFYYRQNSNFGDHLNAWMWDALVPGLSSMPSTYMLCGIGTLLSDLMPAQRRWLVVGSGTGYSPPPDLQRGEWKFACVRGPLTARAMGLPESTAVTDSAILIAAAPDGTGQALPAEQREGVIFIPHWKQLRFGRWREVCDAAGVEFVSPLQDSRKVLAHIRRAKLMLADAMHAAICADTLRVPWVALSISSENHSFKWLDWTLGMQVDYRPHRLPPSSFLEKLQSDLAELMRTDYRLENPSAESAMAFHANTLLHRNSVFMAIRRRIAIATLVVAAVLLRLPGLGALHRRWDARQFHKAVEALRKAASARSCLSDPQVFESRLAQMKQRLDEGVAAARMQGARA